MSERRIARISAHRGAMSRAPENSLTAFAIASDAGADEIEFDVHCAKDGTLVVNHDRTVDRTTDGSGLIAAKRWSELSQLRIYGTEPMCTFDDVAEKFSTIDLQIEIKDAHAVDPLLERMRDNPSLRARSTITSFDAELIGYVARCGVRVHHAQILQDRNFRRLEKFVATNVNHAMCRWRIVNNPILKDFRAAGGFISVWPCNKTAAIRRAIDEGYYGLTTNDPELAVEIRDERQSVVDDVP